MSDASTCHSAFFVPPSRRIQAEVLHLVQGDVDRAWARYERGLACYEEGGYLDHAAAAREMWEQAAAS